MIWTLTIVAFLASPNLYELIDAKRWDEAEAKLAAVAPQARPRFEGLIAQGRGQSAQAAEAFEKALKATPDVPQLHLHAAHAYFNLSRFEDVLRHAKAASVLRETAIAQPLLEARALEALRRDSEAYLVLQRACNTYSNEFRLCLEFALFCHRKHLTTEVRRASERMLSLEPSRDAVLALFSLLFADQMALPMLEKIVAQHPSDAEFRGLLGHVYAGHQRWTSAARLFEEATHLGGPYAFAAADQYRMAEQYRNALRMNAKAPAGEAQRTQRLSILFEQKQYARIVTMNSAFKAPDARYRVAYAHYAVGDYVGAKRHANALLDTAYADEAAALINAMRRDDAP